MDKADDVVSEQIQFESLIKGLIDNDYGCCDDFVIPDTVRGLCAKLTELSGSGNLKFAGVGNKLDFQENLQIRNDKINWIEEQSTDSYEVIYLEKIWRFIHYMNSTCFTSIKSFESHYAIFEKQHFYKRHLDQFKNISPYSF